MLTRRRHQFLERIKKIYRETRAPVHYVEVAEALSVSKWTAYDILLELEKQGFLERQYVINNNEKTPGRSMIKFIPTPRAESIDGVSTGESNTTVAWQQAKRKLLATLSNLLPREASRVVRELLEEVPGKEQPVINCAYVLTIMLVLLKTLGEKAIQLVHHALKKAPRPEAGLFLVAGTGLGLVANLIPHGPLAGQLTGYLSNLQDQIDNLTGGEHKLLLDFVHEALEQSC